MKCSLTSCNKEVLGSGVGLMDAFGTGIDWRTGGQYSTYMFAVEGGDQEAEWVLLHPICFEQVFHELMQQEGATALMWVVGHIGDLRAGMGITEGAT